MTIVNDIIKEFNFDWLSISSLFMVNQSYISACVIFNVVIMIVKIFLMMCQSRI